MGQNSTGFGIALATSAAEQVAAPTIFPICGDAGIEGSPRVYEQDNNITPDVVGIERAGLDLTWKCPDITPTPHVLGYLFFLALGGQTTALTTHVITPADEVDYLNVFGDAGVDLGTNTPTEVGVGGKIGSLSLEFGEEAFAKIEVGGLLCNYGSPIAALTPVLETGDDNAPLSWAAIQHASGYLKLGFAGAAVAADGQVKGIKLDWNKQQKAAGFNLDNKQPTVINEGKRELTFEITREFVNSNDLASYNAVKNGEAVALDLMAVVGASTVQIEIPNAVVVGPFGGDIPANFEDDPQRTLSCKAIQKGSDPLIRATVKDTTSGNYT